MAIQQQFDYVLSKYQTEYLEYFGFFSSNACIFYHRPDIDKNDCPTGTFICEGNEIGLFDEHSSTSNFTYNEAVIFCNNMNSSLSKYTEIFVSLISMISASFDSLDEFSAFAKNISEIVIWTDFERINSTHFWSRTRQTHIEPDEGPDFGNR